MRWEREEGSKCDGSAGECKQHRVSKSAVLPAKHRLCRVAIEAACHPAQNRIEPPLTTKRNHIGLKERENLRHKSVRHRENEACARMRHR